MMIFEGTEAAYGYAMAGLLYGGLAVAYVVTIAMIIREGIRR
jgi:hypothetical protein